VERLGAREVEGEARLGDADAAVGRVGGGRRGGRTGGEQDQADGEAERCQHVR